MSHPFLLLYHSLQKCNTPLSKVLHLTLFASYSLLWKGCSAAVKVSHKFKNSIFRPSSNYIQFSILSLDPLLPIISNSTSRCWKSSFSALSRKPVLKDRGPGVPLWAIFKQQSAKYFNPSCPRPQNNLNSTKSLSRRISRFFGRQCLTCWSFRLLGVRLVLVLYCCQFSRHFHSLTHDGLNFRRWF